MLDWAPILSPCRLDSNLLVNLVSEQECTLSPVIYRELRRLTRSRAALRRVQASLVIGVELGSESGWDPAAALARVDGDEPLLRDLIKIFLEESPKQLSELQLAIEAADIETMKRTAHSLKGELSYLGMFKATQTARDFERMGQAGTLEFAAELFLALEAEIETVAASMLKMLDPKPEPVDP